jgi:hypothetical protein
MSTAHTHTNSIYKYTREKANNQKEGGARGENTCTVDYCRSLRLANTTNKNSCLSRHRPFFGLHARAARWQKQPAVSSLITARYDTTHIYTNAAHSVITLTHFHRKQAHNKENYCVHPPERARAPAKKWRIGPSPAPTDKSIYQNQTKYWLSGFYVVYWDAPKCLQRVRTPRPNKTAHNI